MRAFVAYTFGIEENGVMGQAYGNAIISCYPSSVAGLRSVEETIQKVSKLPTTPMIIAMTLLPPQPVKKDTESRIVTRHR